MRLSLHNARLKHRMLCFCSKSYREHDAVVSDRERWRRECVIAGNSATAALARAREAEESATELLERLKLAIEAQQKAAEQLIAERALRQSAEERAERYHAESRSDLRSAINWSTQKLGGKGMFGKDAPEEARDGQQVEPPAKPMARRVAQEITSETLKAMMEGFRSVANAPAEDIPVGPEFTTQ